jgi:hypothetical protein
LARPHAARRRRDLEGEKVTMAERVDAQELARHQRDFRGFVRFIVIVIVVVVAVLAGMALFLL